LRPTVLVCVIQSPVLLLHVQDRRPIMTIFDEIIDTIAQGFLFTLGAALFFIFGVATGFFDF